MYQNKEKRQRFWELRENMGECVKNMRMNRILFDALKACYVERASSLAEEADEYLSFFMYACGHFVQQVKKMKRTWDELEELCAELFSE